MGQTRLKEVLGSVVNEEGLSPQAPQTAEALDALVQQVNNLANTVGKGETEGRGGRRPTKRRASSGRAGH